MTRRLALLLLLVGCRSAEPPPTEGRFVARYGPSTPALAEFRAGLIANQFLDTIAARLDDSLRIPENITLATAHCTEPNASYDRETRQVTLCYELFESLTDKFATDPAEEYLVTGTVVFALMHELGHALVDVLSLPITGREEDAVDQLATTLLLERGPAGDSLAFGAIGWLLANAESGQLDSLAFADDHLLDLQRVYNLVCWIYGRDSTRYPQVIEQGWLPAHRRPYCAHEYQLMSASWRRLLEPYRRRPGKVGSS